MEKSYTTFVVQPTEAQADSWGCTVEAYTNVVITCSDGTTVHVWANDFNRYIDAYRSGRMQALRKAMRSDGWKNGDPTVSLMFGLVLYQSRDMADVQPSSVISLRSLVLNAQRSPRSVCRIRCQSLQ